MEQMKNVLNALETAVLRLESAIHASKKQRMQAKEQIDELKLVIKTAYDRLDRALENYKKGDE